MAMCINIALKKKKYNNGKEYFKCLGGVLTQNKNLRLLLLLLIFQVLIFNLLGFVLR